MKMVIFLITLICAAILSIGVFVAAFIYGTRRLNRYLENQLLSDGYDVIKIRSTDFRFNVENTSLNNGVSFGGVSFKHGGTGSGMHYREVIVRNQNANPLYVAIEVRYYQPVAYHLFKG